ncbi:hypothetical protein GS421_02315 [Rhodococcus hoagii]|nr:hypothetical protein [Prescottella equi]
MALNWTESGTDVDFGALTRSSWVTSAPPAARCSSGTRSATSPSSPTAAGSSRSRTCAPGPRRPSTPSSCFVGAGGGALHLLQKSGIQEAKGFGGFPVSGQFLRCTNRSSSPSTAPRCTARQPSVRPRCRCRTSTPASSRAAGPAVRPLRRLVAQVLKNGKVTDLPGSVKPNNLTSMLGVGLTSWV